MKFCFNPMARSMRDCHLFTLLLRKFNRILARVLRPATSIILILPLLLMSLVLAGQYVEDLGVAAYQRQVQNLLAAGEAGKTVLAVAVEIHPVEARHTAGIRCKRITPQFCV
jgi:Ferritin-like domain